MLSKLISAAAGREKADLILKNLNIVNVLGGVIEKGDIAVLGGRIAGVGSSYDNAREIIDCGGAYALPGFIDAHAHIESTHLTPSEFAKAVVPYGTTAVIADPHEIANVCGINGIRYIYEESKKLPLDIFLMFPSCVPATPFETSGATLTSDDMEQYLEEMFLGVGELMNYPGVINSDSEVLKKILSAKKHNKVIDGHSGGVTGRELNAYISAGIKTDHECTSVNEMLEKINRGMYIQLREGSAAKNLAELAKGLNSFNMHRCLFCTDDKTPKDILTSGHIDSSIRLAVKSGVPFIYAAAMATINAAVCYGLSGRGALAPGYLADILICEDINELKISSVYKNGKLAAKNGKALFETSDNVPANLLNTLKIPEITPQMFKLKINSSAAKVIKLAKDSIVTEKAVKKVNLHDGCFVSGEGLVKIAVIERHHNTGNIGLGILDGYGIKNGAAAISVAHDSHNVIVAGDNDADMAAAVNALKKSGGGIALTQGGKTFVLPLEIAGLLTSKTAFEFSEEYSRLCEKAYAMGVNSDIEPFMSLSFMSLAVIPHLKLTDKGLFDVDSFGFTSIEG